jgi:phosphate transport system ATP-binding protein
MVTHTSTITRPTDAIDVKAESRDLNFYYRDFHALKSVNIPVYKNRVTALIGPSGCGKSTFLRCFNRMHDLYPGNRYEGEIDLFPDNVNLIDPSVDPIDVRLRVSMVFQKPNPFPKSIYENVAYGLRVKGVKDKSTLDDKIEQALRDAALWTEVNRRLHEPATNLSGGQQQRLCIARSLATDLIVEIKDKVTILIVTHNMQQAARVSDFVSYMYLGELIEYGPTQDIFQKPKRRETEDYITGRFG